jgi:hypothetical protein
VFKIKVVPSGSLKLPDPDATTVCLSSSGDPGKMSDVVKISAYGKGYMDGTWHEIRIPLLDFRTTDNGKLFNPAKTWELDVGVWSKSKIGLTVFIDDIGFAAINDIQNGKKD